MITFKAAPNGSIDSHSYQGISFSDIQSMSDADLLSLGIIRYTFESGDISYFTSTSSFLEENLYGFDSAYLPLRGESC